MAHFSAFSCATILLLCLLNGHGVLSQEDVVGDVVVSPETLTSFRQFDRAFYRAVKNFIPGKNLVMSPLSAKLITGLLALGAGGDTADELTTALFDPDQDFIRSAYPEVIGSLLSSNTVNISLANKVYLMINYELQCQFLDDATSFDAGVELVDFAQNELAAETINTWVDEKTNGLIPNLLDPAMLSDLTRLVLVNTLYFKADWASKFKARDTRKQDFSRSATDKIKVDMMSQTGRFLYGAIPSWNAKAVEIPYKGNEFSMVIFLPDKIGGLKSIEKKLTPNTDFSAVLKGMKSTSLVLSIPKFEIETEMDLKQIYPTMGIKLIFDENNADLKGLITAQNEQLYVTDAIQKAVIKVNEEGTEAAAATAIVITSKTGIMTPKEKFIADRPFLFAIKHNKSGIFLFTGKYVGF